MAGGSRHPGAAAQPRLRAVFTLDGLWTEARLILEIDTFDTHGTEYSFEDDRRRDAYTAARGMRTLRVTPKRWRFDGDCLERDIRRALLRS